MLYCGESNVAPSKYSIMDNKNHFESKVSDFLEALRKPDIQNRLSDSIKRPVVFLSFTWI